MVIYRQPFRGSYPITQKYGEIIRGITYKNEPHTGIDYGCPEETEILASADGVVKYAQFDLNGFGYCVIVRHNDGKATLYAHLKKILVSVGQTLKQGNTIGLSGSTGYATGPHLHFEARKQWNDPKTHFDPEYLPLSCVDDTIHTERTLKDTDAFQAGDLVKITAPLGAKAFYNRAFDGYTVYPEGSQFYYTGESIKRDNGLNYMKLTPKSFSVWVAVNDGDCQIIDE